MNKTIMAAFASTLLAGCQSIFSHNAKLDVRPVGAEQTPAGAAVALEEGRQHLIRGELAPALAAFRSATLSAETAAPAHNGLGIIYALLGRGDLAERYFQQAIAEDPSDQRFAANLARYYQSREAALAKVEAAKARVLVAQTETLDESVDVKRTADRTMQAGPSTVRITTPTPSAAVSRVSRQEIVIRTVPDAPTKGASDPRRRNPRYVAAQPKSATPAYPVRIELGEVARR